MKIEKIKTKNGNFLIRSKNGYDIINNTAYVNNVGEVLRTCGQGEWSWLSSVAESEIIVEEMQEATRVYSCDVCGNCYFATKDEPTGKCFQCLKGKGNSWYDIELECPNCGDKQASYSDHECDLIECFACGEFSQV